MLIYLEVDLNTSFWNRREGAACSLFSRSGLVAFHGLVCGLGRNRRNGPLECTSEVRRCLSLILDIDACGGCAGFLITC